MSWEHAYHRDRLIDDYIAQMKAMTLRVDDDQYFWAVEAMWKLVDEDPETAWWLILDMLGRVEGDELIASIAAGPLENFIVRHGSAFIDRIEAEAAANPKFKRALVGVWGQNRMSEELFRRIQALIQGEPPL